MSLARSTLNGGPREKIIQWRERPVQMVRDLFKVEPDAWQAEALEAFPHSPRLALRACTGPGKAQPVDLMLDTPDGLRRWGDLLPGDAVFAEDGTSTKIKAIYQRGVLPVYRVSFDDGASTLACGDHLWKVRGRTERRHFNLMMAGKWTDRSAEQCVRKGFVVTPSDGYSVLSTEQIIERGRCPDGSRRQFEIPRQGVIDYPDADLPLDPYVPGSWLGDGSHGSPRGSWRDAEIDDEIVRRGYRIGRTAGGKSVTIYGIGKHLRSAGVFALGSHERYIPDAYKRASASQRRDVLAGLMDTDGSIATDNSMSFEVTSERLVDDVAWIVRSLGGVATRKKTKASSYRNKLTQELVRCRPCYRLTVTLPFAPFRLTRKIDRWNKPQDRYLTRYIDRIESEGEAECMCIEVDHPSRCYLTNDFIVTHNTAVLAWAGWNFMLTRYMPIVGATSISGDNLKANLWTELARWRLKSDLLQHFFEMTKTEIFSREHPKTWRMEARTWAKDADANQIGNALRGLHGEYVMWLMDESGDYPDSILPVAEAIFSGNPKEAHIIQAGNPTKLSGPLYRACVTARQFWKVIEITGDPDDPKRSPRISLEHARQQIAQWGKDNPWVLVNIFGRFPPSSFDALLGPDDVNAAMARKYQDHDISHAPRVLGIDVARFGDDASVIFPRQGLVAFKPHIMRNVDGTVGAGQTARTWED